MVKAGASGSTATGIQRGMRYPADDTVLFEGFRSLLSTLKVNIDTIILMYQQFGIDNLVINDIRTGIIISLVSVLLALEGNTSKSVS